jgi:hypothetical protein
MSLGPEHGPNCPQRVRNADSCFCGQNKTLTVPLVFYNNGARYVVGIAKVDIANDLVAISGTIEDAQFKKFLSADGSPVREFSVIPREERD